MNETILDITTNRDFLIDVLTKEAFITGAVTTAFITDEYGDAIGDISALLAEDYVVAAVLLFEALQDQNANLTLSVPHELWGWGSPGKLQNILRFRAAEGLKDVIVLQAFDTGMSAVFEGQTFHVENQGGTLRLNGNRIDLRTQLYDGHKIHVALDRKQFSLIHHKVSEVDAGGGIQGSVSAPMHGNIQDVFIRKGQKIEKGCHVLILEAMKMQHELFAQVTGTVASVHVKAGDQVKADTILIEIVTEEVNDEQ